MKRNYYFLLIALVCFWGKISAQVLPCATDEVRKQMIITHPEILKYEAILEEQIQNSLKKIDYRKAAKTTTTDQTGNPDFWYDIPIAIHVIHDYGPEYLTDDQIFNDLKDWNIVYSMKNPDTAQVISTFKPWMGNVHIRLHLATKDPAGNPTKGITRHRSYLTYIGGEQSKMDDWPSTSYVNIWVVRLMSSGNQEAAAYATPPASAAGNPFGDGIISLFDYFADAYDGATYAVSKTIPHEMGHIFNLEHPWGNNNNAGVSCGDDGVDDTPPTKGHLLTGCVNTALYDTTCASNYFKIYTNITGGDSLVNYPDTINAQNIMDYTYCARMFTKGQVARMHAALNSDVGGRNNLWDSLNLVNTGALAPIPDLKPIPAFNATIPTGTLGLSNYMTFQQYFVFPGATVAFHNETWNDTVTALQWTFSNGALISSSTSTTSFNNSFSTPGWVDIKMTATGNHSGDTTADFPRSVFVPNTTGTPGLGYFQEFAQADTAQWPMFNYYNNEFKWQYANVGYYDHNCIMYTGYDHRYDPVAGFYPYTGSPRGDFDDLFSTPMDLSGFPGACSLNFYYSGASRSTNANNVRDSLYIDYAVGPTNSWTNLAVLAKSKLCNNGAVSAAWVPSSPSDWQLFSINIPNVARTPYTTFRFRFRPNVELEFDGMTYSPGALSSGNNFYMDRITFSPYPAGVGEINLGNNDIVVAPNPTTGDAYVVVKDAGNTSAKVIVTDITGKVVYTTTQPVVGNEARIVIPREAISVQGMYLVQAITGSQVNTRKLVVE